MTIPRVVMPLELMFVSVAAVLVRLVMIPVFTNPFVAVRFVKFPFV